LCYTHIDQYEKQGDRIEMRKTINIVERAKQYRDELQKLLELDFDNPNEDLKKFAEKEKLDLKDPRVKEKFFEIRKQYLEQINKFHEDNILMVKNNNQNPSSKSNSKENKIKKQKKEVKILPPNKPVQAKPQSNKKERKQSGGQDDTRNKEFSPIIVGMIILFIMFLIYIIYDY
jgi:hypothetical protein